MKSEKKNKLFSLHFSFLKMDSDIGIYQFTIAIVLLYSMQRFRMKEKNG